MGDLTLQQAVLRIGAVLLIASVNGFTIGAIACAMGDAGPRHDDRLSINPLRHIDLLGGLLMILFAVGWIRPMAVDPDKLRPGRSGLLLLVASASCATIALAMVLRVSRPLVLNELHDTAAATFFVFVETVTQLCVSFTVFNLLPLPPLTAQHILTAVRPRGRETLRRAQPYFAGLLTLLIVTGLAARLLAPANATVARILLGE